MKKKLLAAATLATIGIGSLGAFGVANAATNTSTTSGTSIVDKIVAKFGLKKADVQAVFDEDRTAHEAERLTSLKDKLATAVKDGKLTQSQSDAIVAKYNEMQSTREANKDKFASMTDTERKSAMDAEKTAFDTWVTSNNIPTEYAQLLHMGGHGGPGGPGMGGMRGDMAPPTTSTNN